MSFLQFEGIINFPQVLLSGAINDKDFDELENGLAVSAKAP